MLSVLRALERLLTTHLDLEFLVFRHLHAGCNESTPGSCLETVKIHVRTLLPKGENAFVLYHMLPFCAQRFCKGTIYGADWYGLKSGLYNVETSADPHPEGWSPDSGRCHDRIEIRACQLHVQGRVMRLSILLGPGKPGLMGVHVPKIWESNTITSCQQMVLKAWSLEVHTHARAHA